MQGEDRVVFKTHLWGPLSQAAFHWEQRSEVQRSQKTRAHSEICRVLLENIDEKMAKNKQKSPNKLRGWENVLLIGREHFRALFLYFHPVLFQCIHRNKWVIINNTCFQRGLLRCTDHSLNSHSATRFLSVPSVKGIIHSEMKTLH